jgi:Tfp pilus assembly protein PilX
MLRDPYGRGAGRRQRYTDNHGIALVAALMFIVVLALLGATTATVTMLSSQASGNYKASIQSFQVAEGGAEEARARLRANATSPIYDTNTPLQTAWQAFIGSTTQAQAYGYTGSASQVRNDSLQTALSYTVVITHATNAGGQLLYWGDPTGTGTNVRNPTTGQPLYLVTSYGTLGGANSTVQTQVARVPPVKIKGTLYVSDTTTLQGSSTYINGNDVCGSTPALPAVVTPLGSTTNGNPTINQNGNPQLQGTPAIQYNSTTQNIATMMNNLKGLADYTYTYASNTTVTGMTWGTPTAGAQQTDPLSCSESHIVYYDMGGTQLKLSGGTKGCGILLVKGDLEINGNFAWYGPVLVTGSIIYTGGGNKNISGALLSGGQVSADVIGGNATILNCSQSLTNATQNSPLLRLNWQQL